MNSQKMKIKLARRLIKSGKYYCPLCGYVMTFITCNVDHIIPKCRGGGGGLSNLQLTHIGCNKMKGGNLQRGFSSIQYPLLNKPALRKKRKKTSTERMFERAAANGNDYAKMINKRMNKYYAEVDARYRYPEIHPL